jgi:hypothetical protein
MADEKILRIVDANSNRTREALRVVEDVLRFSLGDKRLAMSLKAERHKAAKYCDSILGRGMKGLKARDTITDPGRDSMSRSEATRRNLGEILVSNFRRAEESLRVLEEVAKLIDIKLARSFKRSRFRVYQLEKTCTASMERKFGKD